MTNLICQDLNCVYRWNREYRQLECAIISMDGTFSFDDDGDAGLVEEEMVGDTEVTFQGREQTLSDVYRQVEKILRVKQ